MTVKWRTSRIHEARNARGRIVGLVEQRVDGWWVPVHPAIAATGLDVKYDNERDAMEAVERAEDGR